MLPNRFRLFCLLVGWLLIGSASFAAPFQLGPGDVLRISVYGQEDLATTQRVADDGTISFPLIGEVPVGGLSEREVEREIAARLTSNKIVRSPQVSVLIEQHTSQRVSVLGNVNNPGVYPISRGATVVDLIAEAGGLSATAGDTAIVTRQASGDADRRVVNLTTVLEQGQADQDVVLVNGDRIFVPEMSQFFIYGEVQRPNAYRFSPGMTVMEAISLAGGLTPKGTERGLKIRRKSGDEAIETIGVDITQQIQEDDVIYVKESLF